MPTLFSKNATEQEPLAYRLRPETLEEFFGQEELVGKNSLLKKLIDQDQISSIILFGPPGTGKTTLANIIAKKTKANFVVLSAVTSGVKNLREQVAIAKSKREMGEKTIIFIDEIHRFNKAQQDALLPCVEDGTITLIGATTENPSFEVISALLSRSQVFVLQALSKEALISILKRALLDKEKGLGQLEFTMTENARDYLVNIANGDARALLNDLETVSKIIKKKKIDKKGIIDALKKRPLRYDKNGEEHYNLISALHKSLRDSDPDGAVYWLARMLEGGEDPLYIARRLIRFASEDIGNADPHALLVAVATKETCHFVGMPECNVALTQLVVYLAMAPKSNACYVAYQRARRDVIELGNLEVPLVIRNAPTKLMKEWGYGQNYKYAHDYQDATVVQDHLPPELKGRRYYEPTERGIEKQIKS